jgi:hypothetical protein
VTLIIDSRREAAVGFDTEAEDMDVLKAEEAVEFPKGFELISGNSDMKDTFRSILY